MADTIQETIKDGTTDYRLSSLCIDDNDLNDVLTQLEDYGFETLVRTYTVDVTDWPHPATGTRQVKAVYIPDSNPETTHTSSPFQRSA